MNSFKPHQLKKVLAIAATAIASSSLGLAKVEAATSKGFIASDTPVTVTGTFSLAAHPSQASPFVTTVLVGTPLSQSASLGPDIHGTTGNGSVTGTWGVDPISGTSGLLWSLVANIAPGQADPPLFVSFSTAAAFSGSLNNQPTSSAGSVTAPGIERVPEPTSTLSLLALGTLGAASTLKRKLKSSKSTGKETTKVG
ncbi:MAG: PEP-CTERM sorting domain-containing protein [Microcystis sp. LE19-84.1B]|jgi:hypothetical protein|uniref:PEP-CTERM sorting domain-containing protein n=1 Tax=Microcystis sp. LE19-84.1B TaxID=3016438 RepID=UPI0022C6FAB3|nr:PEP-CTERM sorting domain-containing protein [Microcystis sp. LE19-84.1B]MCZ8227352.1 PEP-CTERM sorting domain-containing protein [Microcystis sp. LE19-84.1B]